MEPLSYLPYAQTQTPQADPAEKLVLIELSATLFSSWADGFADVLDCDDHKAIFRLALWVVARSIEVSAVVYVEQVNGGDEVVAYRFWVPLRDVGAAAWSINCSVALPEQAIVAAAEGENKRRRIAVPEVPLHRLDPQNIDSRSKLVEAIRLYQEGRPPLITDVEFDREELEWHILTLLSAEAYFERKTTRNKYRIAQVSNAQASLNNYIDDLGDGPVFSPPESVVDAGLIRRMTVGPAGFLKTPMTLLGYALPIHRPPKNLLIEKLRAILNSTGGHFKDDWENLSEEDLIGLGNKRGIFSDPALFSKIRFERQQPRATDATEAILQRVYPVAFRLQANYHRQLSRANDDPDETDRIDRRLASEVATVLAMKMDEVPTVYRELKKESIRLAEDMRTAEKGTIEYLARKMTYHQGNPKLTPFANLWSGLSAGASQALRLMPRQALLWVSLFARHMAVTENKIGNHGFVIVAGPPDVGKSVCGNALLSSIATALQMANDGSSDKAHTAVDKSADLRVEFQDELKMALNGTKENQEQTMAHQTLIATGVFVYSRMVPNEETKQFEKAKIEKAERKMVIVCTNKLAQVDPAMKSRAEIIPVGRATGPEVIGPNLRVATSESRQYKNVRAAFVLRTKLLSALAGQFWTFEAFGGIPQFDTSMFTVFSMLLVSRFGPNHLEPRRMVSVKAMAKALCVSDLVDQWHFRGVGGAAGFDVASQIKFFRKSAVCKMEHVVAAFAFLTHSTAMANEANDVKRALLQLVESDDGINPNLSADGEWVKLSCNRRDLEKEIGRKTDLGAGLVGTIMSEIERKPNALKFESSNSSDAVLVSIGFLSDITSPVEDAVLAYLASIKGQAVLSWEEDYLCFGSNIRESLFNIELTSSIVPETLAAIPVRDVKAAMRWLLLRKTAAGDVACKTPDAATGANVSKVCSVNSEICITDPAKYKTKKTLIAPILVHKTLLEERKTNPGGIYNALFRDAFAVAGGYDGKEVLVGATGETIVIEENRPVNLTLPNPLYEPYGAIDSLIPVEEQAGVGEDVLFSKRDKTITLTTSSGLESSLID